LVLQNRVKGKSLSRHRWVIRVQTARGKETRLLNIKKGNSTITRKGGKKTYGSLRIKGGKERKKEEKELPAFVVGGKKEKPGQEEKALDFVGAKLGWEICGKRRKKGTLLVGGEEFCFFFFFFQISDLTRQKKKRGSLTFTSWGSESSRRFLGAYTLRIKKESTSPLRGGGSTTTQLRFTHWERGGKRI